MAVKGNYRNFNCCFAKMREHPQNFDQNCESSQFNPVSDFIIMNPGELPELMTVKETAEYLRIPLPTVYYLVQRGQLPAIQIGGRWRIKRSLLDRDILRNESAGQPTVLVVDDDPALQQLFKQFLKKAGFGRIVVGTGQEALQFAEKQTFDLVFLDLKLPDMPGDEVYKALKATHPDVPIVIITGYPDSEVLSRILAHGSVTVIQKPLEFEQLNRTVRQLGHKGAALEAAS